MIYGFRDGFTTYVTAASTMMEYEAFRTEISNNEIQDKFHFYIESHHPDMMEMLTNDHFTNLKDLTLIFTHESKEDQNNFFEHFKIVEKGPNFCSDKQGDMLADAYVPTEQDLKDRDTPIAVLYGLDKNDPWDARTDEQKEADASWAAKAKKQKEAGEMSGDSFGGSMKPKDKSDVYTREIRGIAHDDGTVELTGALAEKHDKPKHGEDSTYEEEGLNVSGLGDNQPDNTEAVEGEDYTIDSEGNVIIDGKIVGKMTYGDDGEHGPGHKQELLDAVYKTDDWRQWKIDMPKPTLSDEDMEKLRCSVKGNEFYVCGSESYLKGTEVWIVPRDYFDETGEIFPESLDIAHLLPRDLDEISPGYYRCKNRDWNHVSYDLSVKAKFIENMFFQLYINNL